MLEIKIAHVIGVNGLLEFSCDQESGLSLWEDIGNNVWTWDQIVESAQLVSDADLIAGMTNSFGEITGPAVADLLDMVENKI
jgi:hypothetical protein